MLLGNRLYTVLLYEISTKTGWQFEIFKEGALQIFVVSFLQVHNIANLRSSDHV